MLFNLKVLNYNKNVLKDDIISIFNRMYLSIAKLIITSFQALYCLPISNTFLLNSSIAHILIKYEYSVTFLGFVDFIYCGFHETCICEV